MTDDHTTLGTALHDRVADEHPDLDRLISVSTRTGTRLRRRRTAAVSVGVAVASVAVVGIVGASLGGGGGTAGSDPGFATQPTPAASPDLRQQKEAQQQLEDAAKAKVAPPEAAPVSVDAPGWRCEEPGDQKFGCSKGTAMIMVNWRPARERADYLDAGKANVVAGIDTFVSEVHGDYFATVTPGQHATQADVDRIAHALVWTN